MCTTTPSSTSPFFKRLAINWLKWLDFRVIRMLLSCEKRKKSICIKVFNLNGKRFILEAHCLIRSNSLWTDWLPQKNFVFFLHKLSSKGNFLEKVAKDQ